jgi:hypothetical protein
MADNRTFSINFAEKKIHSEFQKIFETVYGKHVEAHSRSYKSYALLWTSMTEDWNCLTNIWYRILTSVERLVECMEESIYGLLQTRLYCGKIWLKTETSRQLPVEVSCMEFEEYVFNGIGADTMSQAD